MQIDKVRVQNFKSIQDSGWVSLEDDLTALVGENEAGKSNFLEALSYIGKEGEVPREHLCKESVDDRWNVDRSKCEFISVRLSSSVFHKQAFDNRITNFLISETKSVKIYHNLSHKLNIDYNKNLKEMIKVKPEIDPRIIEEEESRLERNELVDLATSVSTSLKSQLNRKEKLKVIKTFFDKAFENMGRRQYTRAADNLSTFSRIKKAELILRTSKDKGFSLTKFEKSNIPTLKFRRKFKLIEDKHTISNEKIESPYKSIAKVINSETEDNPSFRKYNSVLKTISDTLTKGFKQYWQQTNINFSVESKNENIIIKIKEDVRNKEKIGYSEDRSEGFRWFLSFYLQLMSLDGSGGVDDDVILLDDPGTYLHPKGQKDLREALQKLAEDTQIVYSTHSPYMLDPDETREIRLVQRNDDVDDPDESERTPGTTVHTDLSQADAPGYDTLAPVRAALGAEYADSLFASTANLLVEGYSDETYLKRLSQVFADAADETDGDASDGDTAAGLPDECSVLQMSGAGNTTALVRLLEAEGYDYYVLLDDDRAGDVTREDLDEIGTADEQFGYVTDFLPDEFENAEIEDLFGDERLVELFTANHDAVDREAFANAFDGTEKFTRRACSAVNEVQGRNGADADFQRGDVAKDAMAQDLDRRFAHDDWTVDDLAPEARDAFQELFADVRSAVE